MVNLTRVNSTIDSRGSPLFLLRGTFRSGFWVDETVIMRRLLTIFLVALLAVNSFPLAAKARLLCRVSGQAMQPVAVEDDPRSCCAIQPTSSGALELANRSCCELKTTPGHAPLPGALTPEPVTGIAVLPTTMLAVPLPAYLEVAPTVVYEGTPQYRGPPPSPASPRAPPTFS